MKHCAGWFGIVFTLRALRALRGSSWSLAFRAFVHVESEASDLLRGMRWKSVVQWFRGESASLRGNLLSDDSKHAIVLWRGTPATVSITGCEIEAPVGSHGDSEDASQLAFEQRFFSNHAPAIP